MSSESESFQFDDGGLRRFYEERRVGCNKDRREEDIYISICGR